MGEEYEDKCFKSSDEETIELIPKKKLFGVRKSGSKVILSKLVEEKNELYN